MVHVHKLSHFYNVTVRIIWQTINNNDWVQFNMTHPIHVHIHIHTTHYTYQVAFPETPKRVEEKSHQWHLFLYVTQCMYLQQSKVYSRFTATAVSSTSSILSNTNRRTTIIYASIGTFYFVIYHKHTVLSLA